MARNNESIGISAEVAIARSFGVEINKDYEARSENTIVDLLLNDNCINKIFKKENIPVPIKHIAEGQNPVDFNLKYNKTLSVKTNQDGLGKVAPQIIGQPTSQTYFDYLEKYFDNFNLRNELALENLNDTYENRSYIFKKYSIANIVDVIDMYWENLFDCDYYIHFFNLEKHCNPLENYVVLEKEMPPKWDESKFTFTQSLCSWNESNTLKYCGINIGEFQVHRNRNCFKFRFNIKGLIKLIKDI